jgi:predicted ATP-dependent serine protease
VVRDAGLNDKFLGRLLGCLSGINTVSAIVPGTLRGTHAVNVSRSDLQLIETIVLTTGEDTMEVNRIPTGIASLDVILNGGIPENRVTEIFGPSSSGKSILASLIVASKQHISPELECVWIAVEPFDLKWEEIRCRYSY